jgi:hypothetical protein
MKGRKEGTNEGKGTRRIEVNKMKKKNSMV